MILVQKKIISQSFHEIENSLLGQNSGLEVSEAADPGKAGLDGTSREPPFPEIVEDLGPGATTSASARNLSLPSLCVNQPIR